MKEKKGRGTGIGTLIPTCPTCISCLNFLAVWPELVKIEVPLPKGLSLINLIASSIELTLIQIRAGPNISVS